MPTADEYLRLHGVNPTAVRLEVWEEAQSFKRPFCLYDMEERLPHADPSSLFRALRLLAERHLLHEIDDGTGSRKYCVCHCEERGHVNHLHFTCEKCGRVFCLEHYQIPIPNLPEGYEMHEAECLVKGLCPDCRR